MKVLNDCLLAMTRDCWQLTSPVCYSYQTLDQLLLSSLQWDSAKQGLKLENVPVEVRPLEKVVGMCHLLVVWDLSPLQAEASLVCSLLCHFFRQETLNRILVTNCWA